MKNPAKVISYGVVAMMICTSPWVSAVENYTVTYSEAELVNATGMQSVYSRIYATAQSHCPKYRRIKSHRDVRTCINGVVDDLVTKMNHSGFTTFAHQQRHRQSRTLLLANE